MSHASTVKLLLKRGAIVAAANWPVVLLQFLAETAFKLLLVVPVIAGAFLVALLVGGSAIDLADADARELLAVLPAAFSGHPAAVLLYGAGLLMIVAAGSLLTVLVKGGTVYTLVRGDAEARAVEHLAVRTATLARASAFRLDGFMEACGRLFRRYVRLGLLLAGAYAVCAVVYLFAVYWSFQIVSAAGALALWTVVAAAMSGALVLAITSLNLLYLLLQVAIAAEECGVGEAARLVGRFLRSEAVTVVVMFVTLLVVVGLATAASILAMAAVGLIGFVPGIGLAVFPLHAAGWVGRGLLFQYLGLTALSAYLHLYRVHGAGRQRRHPDVTPLVSRLA
jgi:hypothetical protein